MKTTTLLLIMILAAGTWLVAQTAGPQIFKSPEEARDVLQNALENKVAGSITVIFGPGAADILTSGDTVLDERNKQRFLEAMKKKTVLFHDEMNPGVVHLEIGEDEWPFPIPLVEKNGKWSFDLARGKDEYRYRIIGGNEFEVIGVCEGYVEAQLEYAEKDHDGDGILEYAQVMLSSPGKQDGLYWKGGDSPVSEAFAQSVVSEGYKMQQGKISPYHGYNVRILKAQGPAAAEGARDYVIQGNMIGGFALVAWPAKYGVSGIKTFIVNQAGVVYDKDLGPQSDSIARAMTKFNPDSTWRELE
jgi:hypothetical protein